MSKNKFMTRIMCPYCGHVYLEEDKLETSCPHCNKSFPFESGYKIFGANYSKYIFKASRKLYKSGDYILANASYKSAFDLDDTSLDALFGYVISKFAMSTITDCYFKESMDFLDEKSADFVLDSDTCYTIADSYKILNSMVNYYETGKYDFNTNLQFFCKSNNKKISGEFIIITTYRSKNIFIILSVTRRIRDHRRSKAILYRSYYFLS